MMLVKVMRLLVCGSRTWESYDRVASEIEALAPSLVMHGGAKGADECADYWCRLPKPPAELLVFRAEWRRYHRPGRPNPAGMIRNERMLREGCPDRGLAFGALWKPDAKPDPLYEALIGEPPKWRTTGTGGMVSLMLDARLPVRWIAAPDAPAVDLTRMPEPPK